jgi:Putative peptidoglycan binding domain
MGTIIQKDAPLYSWIKKEIEITNSLKKGSKGQQVIRVQEWLNLHNMGLVIDGDFGVVTKRVVTQFQEKHGLQPSGTVNKETFQHLVSPLLFTLQSINPAQHDLPSLALAYAKAHLAQHPHEAGGQNCGPWVRLYMKGNEGSAWPWCAGFVTFLLQQATETLQDIIPIKGSFSCDTLVAQGKEAGLFIKESDLTNRSITIKELSEGSVFLVRRTSTDWTHAGVVTKFYEDSFETIEGNTNDEGSREGFEVCARTRGYKEKDFIVLKKFGN